jgi:hypothetical protein
VITTGERPASSECKGLYSRQEGPWVWIRGKRRVDEQAVAGSPRETLQRQGDQVSEAAGGHRILTWEEPIVGLESQIRKPFKRVRDQEGPQSPRQTRGQRLGEENPGMSAVSGARSFDRDRNVVAATGFGESPDIAAPFSFIEVGGEKPTAIVGEHGINAHDERLPIGTDPARMSVDRGVVDAEEGLMGAGRAFDLGLFAESAPPFVRASRRVAAAPRFRVFPANRKHIDATAKPFFEQGYLGFGR